MKTFIRCALVLLLLFSALQLVSCRFKQSKKLGDLAVYPEGIDGVPEIRVLIKDNAREALLTVSGQYEIYDNYETRQRRPRGRGKGPVAVSVTGDKQGIKLGKTLTKYSSILIKPVADSTVKIDGMDYNSSIFFIRKPDRNNTAAFTLRILAIIDMEKYLTGVVPAEMPSYWPVEALRAQAVCSRSYALYKIKTRKHLDYDVMRTVASQVWNPSRKGSPIINMVVNSTRGIVMTDNWRLFPAYFSAECGGETKDGVNVFISRHISPLTGVDCPYCAEKARDWDEEKVPLKDFTEVLLKAGYKVGNIRSVKALDNLRRHQDEMGRVYDVVIYHDSTAGMLTLPALKFRSLINTSLKKTKIRSTFFELKLKDGILNIKCRGNGHGVGLCQYGAKYFAGRNSTYKDILNYYYSANTLVKLWN
ncbi:MAG: SpoIID/LytB domain-containing protein [Planctomycetota bacterium]|jgi:stage II sporulation protein D